MFGIDDAVVGALAGTAFSNFMAGERQSDQQAFNAQQASDARSFNADQAKAQRDWETEMSNTSYRRSVIDLQAAGLNPMLAYMHGGASTPSGATASTAPATSGIASPGGGPDIPAAMQTSSNIALQSAEADRIRAETEKTRASTKEIEERTTTYAPSIDVMRQNIEESKERIQKIIQETSTSKFSAANLAQQTINLQAQLPQIAETVKQLRALTTLNYAQAKERGTASNLNEAQFGEVQQRVKANLPDLDKGLKELQKYAEQLQLPRREQESAANDRFIGALGAVIRTLSPLGSLINSVR